MKHFSSFLVITLFFVVNNGFSQVKREVEERISLEKLPNPIKSLLPIIKPNAKHLKFYHEIDGEKESYELKFKKEKTLFSIELISENKDSIKNTQPNRIITKKIGRNELCPCGSGKKYKVCHGS